MSATGSGRCLQVSIVSVTGLIYQGRARFVALPAREGEIGVLPQHAPMLAMLRPGNVRIHSESGVVELIYITGGLVDIRPDAVSILSDVAFRTEQSEKLAAQHALAVAEKALRDGLPIDDIAKAHARLQAELSLLPVSRLVHPRPRLPK